MKIDNSEFYRRFDANENLEEVSYMGIIPQASASFHLSQFYLQEVFGKHSEFSLDAIKEVNHSEFMIKITYRADTCIFFTSLRPLCERHLHSLSATAHLDDDETIALREESFYVDVALMYGDDPFVSYLLQLKLMDCIVPDGRLVIDFSAWRLLPISWVKMLIDADEVPSADCLFSIHTEREGNRGQATSCLYTKGLLRCNCLELEMVGIRQGADQMQFVMTQIAHLFLIQRFAEKEIFKVDFGSFTLDFVWQKRENTSFGYALPTMGDISACRKKTDPSVILFGVDNEQKYHSPDIYLPTLAQYPEYLFASSNSHRQSKFATIQWSIYQYAFDLVVNDKLNAGKSSDPYLTQWSFLVKLGLPVPDDHNSKEHLWFRVLAIEDNQITAQLLNQPEVKNDLNPGNVATYSTDLLTDWLLYVLGAEYTPDMAYRLKQDIENETNNND